MYRNRKFRNIMADTEVAPEASELLFEADDVAELVAEVTGEDVTVEADEDKVEFTVGEEVFTVDTEGSGEIIESCAARKKAMAAARARRVASASAARPARRVVKSSTSVAPRTKGKVVRRSAK